MKKLKSICFYHVVDADGVFSCLIVDKWIKEHQDKYEELDKFGWTYGNSLPDVDVKSYDVVFIVDLMLPVEWMQKYSNLTGTTLIWIDHHLGNIEYSKKFGFDNLPGFREVGRGACELCWEYFFEDRKTPEVIELLSAYDVWNKDRFDWDYNTLPLQLGLKTSLKIKVNTILPIFEDLIDESKPTNQIKERLLDVGRTIKVFEDNRHRIACKCYSFPVLVAGKYKGICCLTTDFGSTLYDSVNKDYEIYICTNRRINDKGAVIYPISMYSEVGKCELNLAEYMQNFGGNGHFNAAGGVLTEDQFFNLLKTQKI